MHLRGFGPVGLLSIVVVLFSGSLKQHGLPIIPIGATLALLWSYIARVPRGDIGFVRPRKWINTFLIGILSGIALKLVMKAVVMPLLGAPAVNQSYQFLTGNEQLLPVATWAMLVAGFSEETVFRGFLFERLTRVLGFTTFRRVVVILISSALFGLLHFGNQGMPGVQQAIITGLVFGTIYVASRQIWLPIVAHATFNMTALALIYRGYEADVAELLFQ